ncbi:hypothetical protein [Mycolicibacterium bacteremicum]|uniref:hypothetical protein n=1 Tax=Mycolicibacterium bacteremicum TaxID=564198 RepID=UPI0026EDF8D7|nr:hypothetical protein [Mycolicibacterium bacteremicum]
MVTIGDTVVGWPDVPTPTGVATTVGGAFSTATTVSVVRPGSADSWPAASVTANSIVRTPTTSVLSETDCNTDWYAAAEASPVSVSTPFEYEPVIPPDPVNVSSSLPSGTVIVTVAPDSNSLGSLTITMIGETTVDCPVDPTPTGVATIVGAPFNVGVTVTRVTAGSTESWPAASVTANSIVRTPATSALSETDCNTVWYAAADASPVSVNTPFTYEPVIPPDSVNVSSSLPSGTVIVTVAPESNSPGSLTITMIGETMVGCPVDPTPTGVVTIVGAPFNAGVTVTKVTPGRADSWPAASVTAN